MSRVNSLNENNSATVELLRSIQEYNIVSIHELLSILSIEQINAPVGPFHITALELASSLPLEQAYSLVQKLIHCGANVSHKDKLGRTPLHLASAKGYIEIVKLLIENGADVNSKYELNSRCIERSDDLGLSALLSLPECFGRTPLHEAVKGNHNEIVKLLLECGAIVDKADENGITPILLATTSVQPNTIHKYEDIISLLIKYNVDINIQKQSSGITPLHQAVRVQSYRATEMLLEAGAIMKNGTCGQTPIHEASARGLSNILSLLLSYEHLGVNQPDNEGMTALHKAAFAGSRECIKILTDYGGDLSAETKTKCSVFDIIFSYVPTPLHLIHEMFDSKITSQNIAVNDVNFTVEMDFSILSPREVDRQMSVIEAILSSANDNQQFELLQHPLIETFLLLKWRRMRAFFLLMIFIHSIFVLCLSIYAILNIHRAPFSLHAQDFTKCILQISAIFLFAQSVFQCFLVPRDFIKQYEMWLNMICPLLSFIITVDLTGKRFQVSADWQLHVTSICVFLAWIELMLLIGRFPRYGYYALMFSTVLVNVIKVLLTFACLVIGFAISFSIQFHTDAHFSDPWRSLVKTTVMMMGEFEYADLFEDKQDKIRLPVTSRIIFLMFIILSSIVLMNLMVGLSVNDIQSIQKEGKSKRLAKQAIFLSNLEKVLSHKLLKSDWFPIDFFKKLHSRQKIGVRLIFKPAVFKRRIKIMGIDRDRHNEAKYIPVSIIDTIINIAINNAKPSTIENEINDKDILLNMMKTLKTTLETELQNIKTDLLRIQTSTH